MTGPAVEAAPVLFGVLHDLDAVVHVYHCDEDWALCGLDVSGHELLPPDTEPVCPLCAEATRCWICAATGSDA